MCTVLLVGRAGSGKSSVGNAILGPDHDKPKFAPRGPSEVKRLKNEMAHNDKFVVVDCSGMGDTGSDMPGDMSSTVLSAFDALIINNSIQDGLNPVKRPAVLQRCGFDALIFVINYVPAFIKQERDAVQTIKSIFGQNVFRNWGILVFSHGDHFKTNMKERGKSFENWCKEQRGEIKSLFEEVRYRCVLFDNKTRDKDELEKQRSKLNELILTLDRPENADSIRKTYFVEDFLSIHKNRIKGWYYYLDKETKRFLAEYKSDTMSESSMTTLQARLTHYWINLKREIEEQMDYFSWEENPQVYREEIKSTKVETKGGETEAYKPMHYKEEEVQFKLNKLHYIEFRRNHQCQFDIKHEYNFKGYTDFLKTKRSDSDDIIANLDKFGKNKCILS